MYDVKCEYLSQTGYRRGSSFCESLVYYDRDALIFTT